MPTSPQSLPERVGSLGNLGDVDGLGDARRSGDAPTTGIRFRPPAFQTQGAPSNLDVVRPASRPPKPGSEHWRAATFPGAPASCGGGGAEGRIRTDTGFNSQRFLRPPRLPFRHFGRLRPSQVLYSSTNVDISHPPARDVFVREGHPFDGLRAGSHTPGRGALPLCAPHFYRA